VKTWKIQKFFGDVVYDLRNRGLLPLAVLLLVAMVAAPIIITRGGEGAAAPPSTELAAKSAADLAPENQAAVLAYDPGVRNYRERLNDAASKNPFQQQFSAPVVAAGDAASDSGASASGGGGGGGGTATGSGGSGGSVETSKTTKYFFYETDVAVGTAAGKLQRRNEIDVFSFLPSQKAPVLVFLGNVTVGGSNAAAFLVSDDVTSVEGGGDCFPSPDSCQMLALKPGATGDLTYAADNQVYRIKVLRVELVTSSKPPKE
jgi:hypothetical protein